MNVDNYNKDEDDGVYVEAEAVESAWGRGRSERIWTPCLVADTWALPAFVSKVLIDKEIQVGVNDGHNDW